MSYALVCIAKLEDDYIEEWVQYYLYIGFDTIYIYENDNEARYAKILKEYPEVIVIPFPGFGTADKCIQIHMLDHFCKYYKHKHRWLAHFDCDEFLVLKRHTSIQEFCKEYLGENEGGIGISWVHFGDNGIESYMREPVTFRFTKREKEDNEKKTDIKTIVCVSCLDKYTDYHLPILGKGVIRNTSGHQLESKTAPMVIDVVQLNHYFCKTKIEFERRKQRGQAGVPCSDPRKFSIGRKARADKSFFDHYNLNEVEDLGAKEIYEKCLIKRGILK